MKRFTALTLAVVLSAGVARADDAIQPIEDFALAKDRKAALAQLIPGTEDYYYYHCIDHQSRGEFAKVQEKLRAWEKRTGRTARMQEVLDRQALLTYSANPKQTLEFLRRRLGLRFNHRKEELAPKSNLPSRLDPNLISRQTLTLRARSRDASLGGFSDSALEWLAATQLDPGRRRHLLRRLKRPDLPNLVQLVLADLGHRYSRGFGSLPIHSQLLLPQLEELLQQRPGLLNNTSFVNAYLSKLHPTADASWRDEPAQEKAYLERLWSFVSRLAPVNNSLKAHVLYQRLAFDRRQGVLDKERFNTYLRIPRSASYINNAYLQRRENRRNRANLRSNYQAQTLYPPVGNDEPLVRAYLMELLLEQQSTRAYEPYVRDVYLRYVFAETMILAGRGDMERWYSMLPPERYQALKERVDLEFAPTTKARYGRDEDVSLELDVKNVSKLIVKVYQLNAGNYYRESQREVDTDIELDGLVANVERTFEYAEPSLRRVRRRFSFPELRQPGTYIVDFIGNGRSSRALVRKGHLHVVERGSVAGHVFTVLDERNQPQEVASLRLGGKEYRTDAEGTITVPYSNSPGPRKVVLSAGGLASLATIQQRSERYSLSTGFYVDREALIEDAQAEAAVRVALSVNGTPVTLSIVEEARLTIRSTDLDGVASTKEIGGFKLYEDRESLVAFKVPPRLARVSFTLTVKVKNLSQGKTETLRASESFALNKIDAGPQIEAVHMMKVNGSYLLEVLGKSGEVRPRRPVRVTLRHRDFTEEVNVSLQTDAQGRIALGPLPGIVKVEARSPGAYLRCLLRGDRRSHPSAVHGVAGETLLVPTMLTKPLVDSSDFSLLEMRGSTFVRDRGRNVSMRPGTGFLALRGLEAGDYDLLLKRSDTRIRVRIGKGSRLLSRVLGRARSLELRHEKPLQIASVTVGGRDVTVQLKNSGPHTRVHVFATRYLPAYSAHGSFSRVKDRDPFVVRQRAPASVTVSGRDIGDEYRYILDRQYAKRLPGNMLGRPSVLLNPWAIRSTESGTQSAAAGEEFGRRGGAGSLSRSGGSAGAGGSGAFDDFANLDFLSQPSAALFNLEPDERGVVTVSRKDLRAHQYLRVVAVDPQTTVTRVVSTPEQAMKFEDTRLLAGLDPKRHLTEQKQTTVVRAGGEFVLEDLTTSTFESYDSLAKVHRLLSTISGDAKLQEFSFILGWPKLTSAQKRAKYSEFACHELSFFLSRKDPAFFEAVILPYLKNKKDKTFLDRYLVGESLDRYLQPWAYGQLNVVERILLGHRVPGEQGYTSRHVQDRFAVLGQRVDYLQGLFATALKSSALDTGDSLGVGAAREKLMETAREELLKSDREAQGLAGGRRARAYAFADAKEAEMDRDAPPAAEMLAPSAAPQPRKPRGELKARKKRSRARRQAPGRGRWAKDGLRRNAVRQLYRKLDKTKEWVENNYYKLPIEAQNADLIGVNAFWRDYAGSDPRRPFVSPNVAEASRNFSEMMFALSVLDLPFEAGDPKASFQGTKMTLSMGSAAVVFHKEIRPAREAAKGTPILVSQNFYRLGDRTRQVEGERVDKFVTEEFLVHTVYGCQVVVTNPTSSRQKLDVLVQIPRGAIPVNRSQRTRSVKLNLGPYSTHSLEYQFYFPKAGKRAQFPVHVAKSERLVASAAPFVFNVVEALSKIDRGSWDWVSQFGSEAQVMAFLQERNLEEINLARIAWRMRDGSFFERVIKLLGRRHRYDSTLWSYGVRHAAVPVVRELLQHSDAFVKGCGPILDSPLLTIDPVVRKTYQHMDYAPLVNARAHKLGKKRKILNDRFHAQYHRLLKILSYKRELDDDDLLAVTYSMLLQDRIEEALAFFARVDPQRLETRLQYDYFAAYMAFYRSDLEQARAICRRYANHPVDRWRAKFANVSAQLDEIAGKTAEVSDRDDRRQAQDRLAASEASFELTVEARVITLDTQNVSSAKINYYLMDLELLFSRNPFVQRVSGSGRFAFIRPNATQTVTFDESSGKQRIALPEKYRTSNVLVEVVAGGETRAVPYYANSLRAQVIEGYGQVRVTADDAPLASTYVKVYAKMRGGEVRFYKDGYTDLRGRFDYASLNTNAIEHVEEFSLLVVSDHKGAVVKKARPPQR